MRSPIELVDDQVRAYNTGDLDGFAGCYAAGVEVYDSDGRTSMIGLDELREAYGRLFDRCPDLHAEIVNRISVGDWVIDEEKVSGRVATDGSPLPDLHAAVAYRVQAGQVDQVRMLG